MGVRQMARWKFRPWIRTPVWLKGGRQDLLRRRLFRMLPVILGVGLALMVIHGIEAGTRPVVGAMARAKLQNTVTALINDTVTQSLAAQAVAYTDLITMQTDGDGNITAMTTDSAKLNALRAEVLSRLIPQVDAIDGQTLSVPLGSLTGLTVLSGLGPRMPVEVLAVTAADAQYRSDFTAAGINQTRHQVLLDVSVEVTLLLSGEQTQERVEGSVCVAETILVGQVPQTYLQWGG